MLKLHKSKYLALLQVLENHMWLVPSGINEEHFNELESDLGLI